MIDDLAKRLRAALADADGLPDHNVEFIESLVQAGEEQLALDTLCTQIYEYDIEVDNAFRSRLEELGTSLAVNVAYLLGNPWADAPGGCESDS